MRAWHGRPADFDAQAELAPEAEWLLQSRQASPARLAEALSREYFPFLFHFSLALLGEPLQASAAAKRVLVMAVQNAYRYPGHVSVRAWLAGFALQAASRVRQSEASGEAARQGAANGSLWPSMDNWSQAQKAAALLRWLFGWPDAEINKVPGLEKADPLERQEDWLETEAGKQATSRAGLDAGLAQIIQSRWPPPQVSKEDLEAIARETAAQAERRSARQKRLNTLVEALVIGAAVLAAFTAGWGANSILSPDITPTPIVGMGELLPTPLWEQNVSYVVQPGDTLEIIASKTGMTVDELVRLNDIVRMEPLYSGQPMWISIPELQGKAVPPTPVTPAPPGQPLNITSSPETVRQAILESPGHWHTLWADLQLVSYPPPHADLGAKAYRFQVWMSQPGKSLELFNDLGEIPLYRHILLNGRNYTSAVLYSGSHLIPDWPYPPNVLLHSPLLREMFFPAQSGILIAQSSLRVVDVGAVAGRKVLVVDVLAAGGQAQYRLWVDEWTGVILRCRKYDLVSGTVLSDRVVTAIAFDLAISPELFDPSRAWLGGFATDASGRPAPTDGLRPAPTWALPNAP